MNTKVHPHILMIYGKFKYPNLSVKNLIERVTSLSVLTLNQLILRLIALFWYYPTYHPRC